MKNINQVMRYGTLSGLLASLFLLNGCVTPSGNVSAPNYPPLTEATYDLSRDRVVNQALFHWGIWGKNSIDTDGYLNKRGIRDNDLAPLAAADDLGQLLYPWQQVVRYWQEGVSLDRLDDTRPEYGHLADLRYNQKQALPAQQFAQLQQRISERPWSAAFISYVMRKSGAKSGQFHFNDAHIRYIKPAYQANNYNYKMMDPFTTKASRGDLLCFAREDSWVYGVEAFREWVKVNQNTDGMMRMHCDIVVRSTDNQIDVVGGNVIQAVMMRQLDAVDGRLSSRYRLKPNIDQLQPQLDQGIPNPQPAIDPNEAVCVRGEKSEACNSNRVDWVALLKWQGK